MIERPSETVVETYRFTPDELKVSERRPGISAFMRIRDGAFSLEAAIRSHMPHFDEIVAVHNRSTDATPDILARLAAEFGPKLRVFHYLPDVYPPGSDGHRTEPADSPNSLVNYYNFALSRTRFSHVTKLDDDHVAMGQTTARLVADVRAGRKAQGEIACFSGLNLARRHDGTIGIVADDTYSGTGDIGVFPVRAGTYFRHDRRFEVLQRDGMRLAFAGFAYWHLKYLKPDFGFANYDLEQNPNSRYARRLDRLQHGPPVTDFPAAVATARRQRVWLDGLVSLGLPMPQRDRLIAARGNMATELARTPLDRLMAQDAELAPFLQRP